MRERNLMERRRQVTRLRKSESAPRVRGRDDLPVTPLLAYCRWVMRRVAEPPSRVGKANRRGSTPSPQSGKRQIHFEPERQRSAARPLHRVVRH